MVWANDICIYEVSQKSCTATDYKGNVCGQYLKTDNTFDNGNAPYDTITELDVGVMPRLVDDLISSSYRQRCRCQ